MVAIAALVAVTPSLAMAGEKEDTALANQVASNLKESGRLHSYKVGVTCRDDKAWLDGEVADASQAEAAIDVARKTDGVNRAISRLSIKGQSKSVKTASHQTGNPRSSRRRPAVQPVSQPTPARPAARQVSMPVQQHVPQRAPAPRSNRPLAFASAGGQVHPAQYGQPIPSHVPGGHGGYSSPARFDHPNMPNHAWPAYAAHPNYAGLTYPKQYSPTAWPFIGPFYPYPQVPLGWRKVTLEWDDGWWMLDFKD